MTAYPVLPLDSWREFYAYNPWHFWGLANEKVPVVSACNTLVHEYAWQNAQREGRSGVRRAILAAEERLLTHLRYYVAPRYGSKTLHYGYPLTLPEGYIQALGVEALGTINAAAPVTFSDLDGDGLNETFTISVATTVTDPSSIAVYFAAADRYDGSAVGDRWRVQPVKVSISAGVATIRGAAWLIVRPVLYQGVNRLPLDPDVAANFASTLAVYERTTDTDQQATLLWNAAPYPSWCCVTGTGNNASDPAAVATATARVGIRDAKLGIVLPLQAVQQSGGEWVAGNCINWCRPPDRITINYLAGHPLEADGLPEPGLREAVTRLSGAILDRSICACDDGNKPLASDQGDAARAGGLEWEQFRVSQADLGNPLGTKRGAIRAWHIVASRRQLQGIIA